MKQVKDQKLINELDSLYSGKKAVGSDLSSDLDERLSNQELINSIKNIPKTALSAVSNLPQGAWNLSQQVPSAFSRLMFHPDLAARDVGTAMIRNAQKTASAGLELGEYLTRKGGEYLGQPIEDVTTMKMGSKVNIPKWNAREFMGLEGDRPLDLGAPFATKDPNQLLSILGEYGLGGAAGGHKILPLIAANAITSAINAPPGQRIEAATEGAVGAGVLGGLAKGTAKTVNTLRPSNLLRGNLTPQELAKNLEITQGTTTGLGDVLGSPSLKKTLENRLPGIPLSGTENVLQQTGRQVTQKGADLLESIGDTLPQGDKTAILQNAIKNASREARNKKNELYKVPDNIANKAGIEIPRTNFQKIANETLQKIDQSPELKAELPSDIYSNLKRYAKNQKGNTLEASNIFKGKLGDKASEYYKAGKMFEYNVMRDLKDALGNDIEQTIESSNIPELKDAYRNAQENYALNFKPFEDPAVTKFTREGGDPDLMLSHFLKTGANDRSTLLNKLTSKLPKELQQLPLYMHLSKAINKGEFSPTRFRTLYNKLGDKQKELLIPDTKMRKSFEDYTKLVEMNIEGLDVMRNPKTGYRNLQSVLSAIQGIVGYGVGNVPGAIAGLTIPGMAAKLATHVLTSPKVRQSLVQAIIKSKGKNPVQKQLKLLGLPAPIEGHPSLGRKSIEEIIHKANELHENREE